MQNFAPQSLPVGAARKATGQRIEAAPAPQRTTVQRVTPGQPAIQMGQYIRRERGMQGVRSYVAAMREFLPSSDFQALCKTLGVPQNVQQKRSAPQQNEPKAQQNKQPDPPNNPANQMQMMQMMSQLMNMQNGGGGGGGSSAANGINPAMLAQLLNSMSG